MKKTKTMSLIVLPIALVVLLFTACSDPIPFGDIAFSLDMSALAADALPDAATVTVEDASGQATTVSLAVSAGTANGTIRSLPVGIYTAIVSVLKSGLETGSGTGELTIVAAETVNVTITLTPAAASGTTGIQIR